MPRPNLFHLILVPLLCIAAPARALGPHNTAVVVNADSFASRAIANEFVSLRDIPDSNVIELHLASLPNYEEIGVDDFRKLILQPVFEAIAKRSLTSQIDCIAYSSDIPYAIHISADVKDKKLPQVITPVASLNGLTYLYQQALAKDINYLDLTTNHYARPVLVIGREKFSEADQQQIRQALILVRDKKWHEASDILASIVKVHPKSYELQYDLACSLAHENKLDEATAALTAAVDAGFWDAGHLRDDDDLKPLRERKEFKELLGKIKPPPLKIQPPIAFHSADAWAADGSLLNLAPLGVTPEGGPPGNRYMLSIMLGVTSGRGNSVREVLDCLRRGKQADGSWPKGTIFYMVNGDVRSTTRQWGFQGAADALQKLGISAELTKGVLPENRPDVAGAMVGIAGFDWSKSNSTILPGAICEHLTSTGGVMVQNAGQTPISEFIRRGAAGTSGTVTEPYALQQKFPNPFIHYYYAQGATLIESFYQSLTGPYQLLILGDPLCRPWANIPAVSAAIADLHDGEANGVITLTPSIKPAPYPLDHYELLMDGHTYSVAPSGKPFIIDTTKLSDGHHDLRVVAIGSDTIQTQSFKTIPLTVNNKSKRLTLSAAPATLASGALLKLSATCLSAERIVFLHNNEEIASIAGEKGDVEIETSRLGPGPIRILPVALLNDTGQARIAAQPIQVTLQPSAPLPPKTVDPKKLTKGLLLRPSTRPAVALDAGSLDEALGKAGLKDNQPFSLDGYVDVAADDLYQFQLRFNGEATLKIDDHALAPITANKWNYLPVSLSPGLHHLEAVFAPKGGESLTSALAGAGLKPSGRTNSATSPPPPSPDVSPLSFQRIGF